MVNTIMLVGRLAQDVVTEELESGKKINKVVLAVNRTFKNPDGAYETDFFDCILWDALATNVTEYCKKGDTVGVKGRLQTKQYEEDGVKRNAVEIIVERLTFLSSKQVNAEA